MPKEEVIEELRPYLKEGTEEAVAVRIEALLVRTTHDGPFPHALELASYENTLPGAAERIFTMMEKEQAQRHSLESKTLHEEIDLNKRGQLYAFLGLVGSLLVVVLFLLMGQAAAGATFGGLVIVGVVGAFLGLRKAEASADRREPPSPDA